MVELPIPNLCKTNDSLEAIRVLSIKDVLYIIAGNAFDFPTIDTSYTRTRNHKTAHLPRSVT